MSLADFSVTRTVLNYASRGGSRQFLIAVGTMRGRALLYKIENNEQKMICKTKAGMLYGECSSLCLSDDGTVMITASESGELSRYDLKEVIKERAD